MRKRMLWNTIGAVALLALAVAPRARAGPLMGSGALSWARDGADWDYTIALTNVSGTGGDDIGTFWFSWVPGQGYLPSRPLSIGVPAGWAEKVTNGPPPGDGYSIQWVAGASSALAPGGTLNFMFQSADAPSVLLGNSSIHAGVPVGTSVLYQMGPFQGDTETIAIGAAPVPEPSTLLLGIFGAIGTIAYRRLRHGPWRARRP